MAYNNYIPQFYNPNPMYMAQPPQMPTQPPQMPQNGVANNNGGITWVQGEAAAKAHPVASGQSVLLMDSEESTFYIKSMDQSGMPLPLRIFDYTERKTEKASNAVNREHESEFVPRSEFDSFKEKITKEINGIRDGSEIGEG